MDRERTSRSLLLDIALAAGLCAVGVYEVLVAPLAEDVVRGPVWLNLLAVAATTVPLAWRRRAPFWVAVAVAAATAGRALAAEPLEIYPTSIALLVATYTVASYAPLRESLLAVGFGAMAVAVAVVQGTGTDAAPDPLASAILYGMVWLVGRVVGVRHQRAVQLHLERDAHAAEAVADERARIAREMHDAVSHSLAAIVMQSGGAANVLDSDPERARQSLASIEATARRGLEEMRRMLGLLGESDAELAPQPGLDRLDELVATVRAAGIEVDSTFRGERRPLPAAVDVSAYRLVQESLTNVMKHAGARSVRVALEQAPEHLDIEVVDDGTADSPGGTPGRGLAGMRERAEVLGGWFEAAPLHPGPGFRVAARLPL
jgi:signal transduction histidine kinase